MIAKYKKNILVRRLITILAVVASALLQTYVIQAFIRPANLLSSGFTGLAILIDRIAELYGFPSTGTIFPPPWECWSSIYRWPSSAAGA